MFDKIFHNIGDLRFSAETMTAIKGAALSAELCRGIEKADFSKFDKKDRSPVTIADYASQALFCKIIRETFKKDQIVGEESSSYLKKEENRIFLDEVLIYLENYIPGINKEEALSLIDEGAGIPGGNFWTIDPIDGTKGFLRKEQYCTAVAFIKNGEVLSSALGCPALNDEQDNQGMILFAEKEKGAFSVSMSTGYAKRIKVSGDEPTWTFVQSYESSHGDVKSQQLIAERLGMKTRMEMDSQVKYGVVAMGRADIYARIPSPEKKDYKENIWDHAPGALIVMEAGGKVTDLFGNNLIFDRSIKMSENCGIVASNGSFHDDALRVIRNILY